MVLQFVNTHTSNIQASRWYLGEMGTQLNFFLRLTEYLYNIRVLHTGRTVLLEILGIKMYITSLNPSSSVKLHR